MKKSIFRTAETLENKGFLPFSYTCLSLICRLNPQADTKRWQGMQDELILSVLVSCAFCLQIFADYFHLMLSRS